MKKCIKRIIVTAVSSFILVSGMLAQGATDRPNIIFILADDLGYGDLNCTGAKFPTPNLDRMAEAGMRFTDAHTTSSVCSPTRYSLLTGRFNWRRLEYGIVRMFGKPLIEPGRKTIADFLKEEGYRTGMVGKWHLGHEWEKLPNGKSRTPEETGPRGKSSLGWDIDYTKRAGGGPCDHGFDEFSGIDFSLDGPPWVYIRNDRAVSIPTVDRSIGARHGPAAKDLVPENVLRDFACEGRNFIAGSMEYKEPFFLYLAFNSPHTPIVPSEKWVGKSGCGLYGDFVMETDWAVGEIFAELDALGLTENTIVIFSSDNGSAQSSTNPAFAEKGHRPNGNWRGRKTTIYEGGHRVPFLVQWSGKVKAGTTCNSLIILADFFATVADIVGVSSKIDDTMAEDSYSFLPDLLGTGTTDRKTAVHHSVDGSFSIRQGDWKLILCPDSGGNSKPIPKKGAVRWETDDIVQLYNLKADPAETNNVWKKYPERCEQMAKQMGEIAHSGRSTPGTPQSNNVVTPDGLSIDNPEGLSIDNVIFPDAIAKKFQVLNAPE